MGNCKICGRPLSNPSSVAREIGPVCASKLNIVKAEGEHGKSSYAYHIVEINGHKVGVVIDLINEYGGMSVTNNIEKVAAEIGVDKIVYCDSMSNWDYWSLKTGFKTLAVNGEATKSERVAIKVAEERYLTNQPKIIEEG